jgi:hypothetical protein
MTLIRFVETSVHRTGVQIILMGLQLSSSTTMTTKFPTNLRRFVSAFPKNADVNPFVYRQGYEQRAKEAKGKDTKVSPIFPQSHNY